MLYTSLDGQWIAVVRDRVITIQPGVALAADEPAARPGTVTLDGDAELAMIGPPNGLLAIARDRPVVTAYELPALEASAPLAVDAPMRLAAATGSRIALVAEAAEARKHVVVVRAVGRALSSQRIDPGGVVEFVVGLERNQLLLGLARKLEVWDAVSARPLLRLQLQLPPAPRRVGAAHGHLWVTRPGSDEVYVYRLSDGRPFRHHAGAPVEDVIAHPLSPVIVLVTTRSLVRLNCFAHSLALLDAPWTRGTPLAQLVSGDDQYLIGLDDGAAEPWRASIGASAAPALAPVAEPPRGGMRLVVGTAEPHAAPPVDVEPPASVPTTGNPAAVVTIASASAMAESAAAPRREPPGFIGPASTGSVATVAPTSTALEAVRDAAAIDPSWRDVLAAFATELFAGAPSLAVPAIAADSELDELVAGLGLPAPARRALVVLYASYLVGKPALPLAQLARIVEDWHEPLGRGELAALAMLHRQSGRVALRTAVTDRLDGAAPRTVRVVGETASTRAPRGGLRFARAGKSADAIESELVTQLGRIAVIEGGAVAGLLEARLHAATAVAFSPPQARPQPWPRDAGLIVVVDGTPTDWVAGLPAVQSSSNV